MKMLIKMRLLFFVLLQSVSAVAALAQATPPPTRIRHPSGLQPEVDTATLPTVAAITTYAKKGGGNKEDSVGYPFPLPTAGTTITTSTTTDPPPALTTAMTSTAAAATTAATATTTTTPATTFSMPTTTTQEGGGNIKEDSIVGFPPVSSTIASSSTTEAKPTEENAAVVADPTITTSVEDQDDEGVVITTATTGSTAGSTAEWLPATQYIPHHWNLRTFVVTIAGSSRTATTTEATLTEALYLEMTLYLEQRFGGSVETLELFVETVAANMWEYSGSVSFVPQQSTVEAILHEVQVWQAQIDFLQVWVVAQRGTVVRVVMETGQVIGEQPPAVEAQEEEEEEEEDENRSEIQRQDFESASTRVMMTTTAISILAGILLTRNILF